MKCNTDVHIISPINEAVGLNVSQIQIYVCMHVHGHTESNITFIPKVELENAFKRASVLKTLQFMIIVLTAKQYVIIDSLYFVS